jgi:small subunit ribosomal protein S8
VELPADKKFTFTRISKPGRRIYSKSTDLKPVLSGLGIAVLSTSEGLMTNSEAHKKGIGGEIICEIY